MKQMKRAVLNEVFSQKPEKPIYHYTTQSGLLGIIKSRQIWATHTQYLNDRREFRHALDLVSKEIDSMKFVGKRERKNILNAMDEGLRTNPESVNVCVCSFSEDSDSLSQWRAYSGGASGFAIGLPGDFLARLVEKKKWYLARCIYDPTKQGELIRSLIEEAIEEMLEKVEEEKDEGEKVEGGKVEEEKVEGEKVEGEKVEGEKVEGEKVEGESAENPMMEGNYNMPSWGG